MSLNQRQLPRETINENSPHPKVIITVDSVTESGTKSLEGLLSKLEISQNTCLKFSSRNGGHYVTKSKGTFFAVFSGDHGPENRPASIDRENLNRLYDLTHEITVLHIKDSPFTDVAIKDIFSKEN